MLAIVLFLWGIGKEQETAGGVLTGLFWPTDATSSQHRSPCCYWTLRCISSVSHIETFSLFKWH